MWSFGFTLSITNYFVESKILNSKNFTQELIICLPFFPNFSNKPKDKLKIFLVPIFYDLMESQLWIICRVRNLPTLQENYEFQPQHLLCENKFRIISLWFLPEILFDKSLQHLQQYKSLKSFISPRIQSPISQLLPISQQNFFFFSFLKPALGIFSLVFKHLKEKKITFCFKI